MKSGLKTKKRRPGPGPVDCGWTFGSRARFLEIRASIASLIRIPPSQSLYAPAVSERLQRFGFCADAGGTLTDRCSDLQAFVIISVVEIGERAVRRHANPLVSDARGPRTVLRTSRLTRGTREAWVHGLSAAHLRESDPRTSREIWPAISLACEQNVTLRPHSARAAVCHEGATLRGSLRPGSTGGYSRR